MKVVVNVSRLYDLFGNVCCVPYDQDKIILKNVIEGSSIILQWCCLSGHIVWRSSSPFRGSVTDNSSLFSSDIAVFGNHSRRIAFFFRCLGFLPVSKSTFYHHQKSTIAPIVEDFWKAEQDRVAKEVQIGCAYTDGRWTCRLTREHCQVLGICLSGGKDK